MAHVEGFRHGLVYAAKAYRDLALEKLSLLRSPET